MKALFVSSVLGHKKFEDRARALKACGYEVTVVALDWSLGRRSADKALLSDVSLHLIGRRPKLSFLGRVGIWFKLAFRMRSLARSDDRFDVIVANTLEMMVFAEFFFGSRGREKYFDLADIHSAQYSGGLKGALVRLLERYWTSKGWSYVVTSPWFYWEYVVPKISSSRIAFLVENKVVPQQTRDLRRDPNRGRAAGAMVLWNGVLRCNTSGRALLALVRLYPREVCLRIAGDTSRLAPDVLDGFRAALNVELTGAYEDSSLGEIFEGVDVVWVSDFDDGLNSRLLLPNRLYQAMIMGVKALSAGETATSRYVRILDLGEVAEELAPECLYSALCRAQQGLPSARRQPSGNDWAHVFQRTAPALPAIEDFNVLGRI